MVTGVVDHDQHASQDASAIVVANGRQDINVVRMYHLNQFLYIHFILFYAAVPRLFVSFRRRIRPISLWPRRGNVPGIHNIFEDIILGNPDVLNLMPESIWHILRFGVVERRWEITHRTVET